MKTSEALVEALRREVEGELQELVRRVAEVEAASLKDLEREVLHAIFRLGRRWLGVAVAWQTAREAAPARRQGTGGHRQRLVGWRPKQLLTLLGEVGWSRPYYQCQTAAPAAGAGAGAGAAEGEAGCGHGEAPADARLGVQGRRTSAGVQEAGGFLAAYLPLAEVAANLSRLLPLQLSARQVLALIQPVGEALRAQEDAHVQALWAEAAQPRTGPCPPPRGDEEAIPRLYVEMEGVMARLRRGRVAFEDQEAAQEGDVYREVKVGAVFAGTPGRERSTVAPAPAERRVDTVDAHRPTR